MASRSFFCKNLCEFLRRFRISDKVRAETFAKETLLANRKLMKFYEPHPFSVHADPQSTFEMSYVNAMFMARSQEDPAKFPNLVVRFTATRNDFSWQVVQQSIQLSHQSIRLFFESSKSVVFCFQLFWSLSHWFTLE